MRLGQQHQTGVGIACHHAHDCLCNTETVTTLGEFGEEDCTGQISDADAQVDLQPASANLGPPSLRISMQFHAYLADTLVSRLLTDADERIA